MNKLQRSIAAFAFSFLVPCAGATTFSTDTSDLWYNPNESGWGLSVNQQDATLFAVLFVYGANGQASWYVAPDMRFVSSGSGGIVFSGALYQTTGPYYAQPFVPGAVGTRAVGAASFTLTNLTTASFGYSIDNGSFVKEVVRQTWAINNMTGNYLGGRVGSYAGCPAGAESGYREEPGTWAVQHDSGGARLTYTGASVNCTYDGAYAQSGHFGLMTGNFSCTNGQAGAFQAFEINAQLTAIAARISSSASNGCAYEGRLGGLRRTP